MEVRTVPKSRPQTTEETAAAIKMLNQTLKICTLNVLFNAPIYRLLAVMDALRRRSSGARSYVQDENFIRCYNTDV